MSDGERIPVAVLGATGAVGQRLVTLLADHPWFRLEELLASETSAGRPYREAVDWLQPVEVPPPAADLEVAPVSRAVESPLIFSALPSAVAGPVEAEHAARGLLVVSNASSHRMDRDVPLVVPEVNPDHLEMASRQDSGGGAIVANPNCSSIGLVLALAPLVDAFGVRDVHVVTLQALSGAGHPGVPSLEIQDNVVPYVADEEEKLERESRKILGALEGAGVAPYDLRISAQCNRVPVVDGHLECVSVSLGAAAGPDDVVAKWDAFRGEPQRRGLPSAPDRPVRYLEGERAPQPRLHRDAGEGMTVTAGRLRPCPILDYRFVTLSHNTVRGAAGGAVLTAELALARETIPGLTPPRGREEPPATDREAGRARDGRGRPAEGAVS